MNLSLQNPALLGLLGLVVLPLVVHLVSRVKPPVHRFSNLDFLRRAIAYRTRFKAPRDWLLLVLRTLAVLALMAAFLLPLLRSERAALPGEQRSVVIVVDRSASMAAREGASTRLDAATARAAKLLEQLRPDLANIVWMDAFPDSVLPEPAPNLQLLGDQLLQQTPSHEAAAIEQAIELAARQLADAPGRRELHVISDFQESAWRGVSLQLPEDLELNFEAVADSAPVNLSIDALSAVPTHPIAGQHVLVQCQVVNHSGQDHRTELTLDAGGSRQSQALAIPAGGAGEASFKVQVSHTGLLPITAEISGDGFPQDNRRHTVVRVRESIQLAVAAPADHPTSAVLTRVAGALPWLEVIPGAVIESRPSCDILWIPEWDGRQADLLAQAREQCALIVSPGPQCPIEALSRLSGHQLPGTGPLKTERREGGWQALPDTEHRAFALFRDGQYGNPLAGTFQQRVSGGSSADMRVVARFQDDQPALLEALGHRVLIALFPMDPLHSSWSLEHPFLPAIGELLLHIAPQGGRQTFLGNPGEALSWKNPMLDPGTNPVLIGPGDQPLAVRQDQAVWISEEVATPGIHQWLVSGQPVMMSAVNFPASESRLQALAAPPRAEQMAAKAARGIPTAFDRGLPLWPWLIALAALLLAAEQLVMGLMPARRTEPTPHSPAP